MQITKLWRFWNFSLEYLTVSARVLYCIEGTCWFKLSSMTSQMKFKRFMLQIMSSSKYFSFRNIHDRFLKKVVLRMRQKSNNWVRTSSLRNLFLRLVLFGLLKFLYFCIFDALYFMLNFKKLFHTLDGSEIAKQNRMIVSKDYKNL